MAQVVEADRAQAGALLRGDETTTQRGRIDIPAELAAEHQMLRARTFATLAECREDLCDLRDHRDDAPVPGLGCGQVAVRVAPRNADR